MSETQKKQFSFVFFEELGHGWTVSKEIVDRIHPAEGPPAEPFSGAKVAYFLDFRFKKRPK